MKKVLITGAAGFIGNRLLKLFIDKGYMTIGWDRKFISNDIKKVEMNDFSMLINALNSYRPNIIVHCAGNADVGKSIQDPEADYSGNVTVTHNLMFAIHKLNLEKIRFVFLSSAGVYGNPTKLPITEDMSLNPLSPYAVHKVMCEELCKFFSNNYGTDIKIARIFSAYGNGLSKQIFWDMYNKTITTGKLDMFGSGKESRDYIHIDDVIQALYILAVTDSPEILFNVANGEEITIREVTEIFAQYAGISTNKITFNGVTREGDPLNWKADISKMKKIGYRKTLDIEQGLADYYNWVRSFKGAK